jgi:hypothetical protein
VRATLGEISTALGDVFGYHRGGLNLAGGAYAAEFGEAEEFVSTRKLVDAFAEKVCNVCVCVSTRKLVDAFAEKVCDIDIYVCIYMYIYTRRNLAFSDKLLASVQCSH